MNMRASGASELRKFSHSKTAISFNILLVLQILCLRNTFIQCTDNKYMYFARASASETYIFRTQITINAVSFNYIEKMYLYICERASLENFWHFHVLKLLFLSIFLLVLHILCLRNIFTFRCQITSAHI